MKSEKIRGLASYITNNGARGKIFLKKSKKIWKI